MQKYLQKRRRGDRVVEEPHLSEMTERNINKQNRGIDNSSYIPTNLSNNCQ